MANSALSLLITETTAKPIYNAIIIIPAYGQGFRFLCIFYNNLTPENKKKMKNFADNLPNDLKQKYGIFTKLCETEYVKSVTIINEEDTEFFNSLNSIPGIEVKPDNINKTINDNIKETINDNFEKILDYLKSILEEIDFENIIKNAVIKSGGKRIRKRSRKNKRQRKSRSKSRKAK